MRGGLLVPHCSSCLTQSRCIHALLLLLLLSRFSHVRPCATSKTAAHQAPPSLGVSRQEHWSGLPFPSPMESPLVTSQVWISSLHNCEPTQFCCLSLPICNALLWQLKQTNTHLRMTECLLPSTTCYIQREIVHHL